MFNNLDHRLKWTCDCVRFWTGSPLQKSYRYLPIFTGKRCSNLLFKSLGQSKRWIEQKNGVRSETKITIEFHSRSNPSTLRFMAKTRKFAYLPWFKTVTLHQRLNAIKRGHTCSPRG